ncbi:MAG: hypothetical protein M0R21_04135 [Lentimicrobiaceae bacterium]|nr:hypothetical protein [Lentimicrobiaceae bacterium]
MINIIVVEDNPNKKEKIRMLIENSIDIPKENIDYAPNVNFAKRLIYKKSYDLMILDLVLPLDNDEIPKPETGLGFLDDLHSSPQIKPIIHIVGLTEFSDYIEKYKNKFGDYLWHLINYKAEESDWQEKLKNILYHLIKTKKEFLSNENIKYDYDIAIITAVSKEKDAVLKLDADWSKISILNDSTSYYQGVFARNEKKLKVVSACTPQMGMNAAATLSMKLIYNFRPRYLIMVGILASTKETATHGYGDIIVADQSWDGGAGKITEDNEGKPFFKPGANYLALDADLKERILSYQGNKILSQIRDNCQFKKPNTILQLHVGPVASVAGVTENREIVEELEKHQRKIIGIEMETYGVFYSANNCSNPKPKVISIKSISDFANTDKNDIYQEYASYTSSEFMYQFVLNEL